MSFFDWWSFVADTLGVITALVAVPAVIKYLFVEPRRRRESARIMSAATGSRTAVLAIGLGARASMESPVKVFINSHKELLEQLGGAIQNGSNFFLIENRENLPEPDAGKDAIYSAKADQYLDEVIASVNQTMIAMAEHGVGRVHLFYQGPAIPATAIGAALSNRYTVICYHYARNTGYYSVGLMQGV